MCFTSRNARSTAATAKAAASAASTQPGPIAATIAPPSAAPPRVAPCIAIRNTANARPACSPSTEDSSMPSAAGLKNACPAPPSPLSSIICHSCGSPARTSAANAACETQFRALAATITRCRGSRSATAPPISRNSTSGRVRAAATRPTSPPSPPAPSTANAEAISAPWLPRLVTTAEAVSSV